MTRGGAKNCLPSSIKTEADCREYISNVSKDKNIKTIERRVIVWLGHLDAFRSHVKNDPEKFKKIPPEIMSWCHKQKARIKSGNLPPWKIDALQSSSFIEYMNICPAASTGKQDFKTLAEFQMNIGEISINGRLNKKNLRDLNWITLLSDFKDHLFFGVGKNNPLPGDLKVWASNTSIRYMKRELPGWKIQALDEINFLSYCLCVGKRIGIYSKLLVEYKKNNGSYVVKNAIKNSRLYRWRISFALNASDFEAKTLFSLLPGITDSEKKEFMQCDSDSTIYKEDLEEAADYLTSQNAALAKRFEGQSANQAYRIMKRQLGISIFNPVQYEAFIWLESLNSVIAEMNNQKRPLIELELSVNDKIFIRKNYSQWLSNKIYEWQKRFLGEIGFDELVRNRSFTKMRERMLLALRSYFVIHGTILIPAESTEHPGLYKWRLRLSREFRKTPKEKWKSKEVFSLLRDSLQDVSEEELEEFLLRPPSSRSRYYKQG